MLSAFACSDLRDSPESMVPMSDEEVEKCFFLKAPLLGGRRLVLPDRNLYVNNASLPEVPPNLSDVLPDTLNPIGSTFSGQPILYST